MPVFTMNIYDRVVPNNAIETLWMLSAGLLLVFGMDYVIRLLRGHFVDLASSRIDLKLSSLIMERVLGMRLAHQAGLGGFVRRQPALVRNHQGFHRVGHGHCGDRPTLHADVPRGHALDLVAAGRVSDSRESSAC
jgi:hypothetical protein